MSRARKVAGCWWDVSRNGQKASGDQLELLASVEDVEIDDILDSSLTQGDVVTRLRSALGLGAIPAAIVARREERRKERQTKPKCRICDAVGNSTAHHFVNKWIMKELSNYVEVAPRRLCTIPVCIECHRDLHFRGGLARSIVPHLTDDEKAFANALIERLRKEKPKLFDLLSDGEDSVYEARLIKDWIAGKFDKSYPAIAVDFGREPGEPATEQVAV